MDAITLIPRGLPRFWRTRREVAMEYFPHENVETAVAQLRRWIKGDPEFLRQLCLKGYRPHLRAFSPQILRVFRRFLG